MTRFAVALDTATETVAAAVGMLPDGPGEPVVQAAGDESAPRASLSRALPIVRDLLADVGADVSDLDLVVVGCGPGSYTGVRIGIAAAKGLAQGLDVPLLGVGTLDALAWGLRGHEGMLGVVGDAMRQEVYPALFELSEGDVTRLTPDRVADPAEVATGWAAEVEGTLLLAGDGLAKHGETFREALGDRARVLGEGSWRPSGAGVLHAAGALGARSATDAGSVLPVYTRLSDAEHREEGRGGDVPRSGVAGPVGGDG